ncbi:MAG: hypothetical protein WC205_17730 [Opitutaceae bacterium]|jgi:Na+-transporting methylmalonyl-CoA/oxaloacetate decarboxylase gamma subunit
MTPDERARVDSITAAFDRSRRHSPIPGISSTETISTTGKGLRYAVLFVLVLALHAAGFLLYQNYSEAKSTELIAQAQHQALEDARNQELAEMRAVAAAAQAAAAQLSKAMAQQRYWQTSQVTQPQPPPTPEYNVVRTTQRPQPVTQQFAPTPPEPVAKNRSSEHASIAYNYLVRKKSNTWNARITSTKQVTGWEGRYRTEFEIPRNTQGTNSLQPRRYEVLTQEKDGQITAIDLTTKGY